MIAIIDRFKREEKIKKIAVVSLASDGIVREIDASATATLQENNERDHILRTKLIVGNGSKERLRQVISEDFRRNQYDLIFSIGSTSTLALQDWTLFNRCSTPIIFGGVYEFLKQDLMQQNRQLNKNFTGVYATFRDYKEQIELLLQIKSDIKTAAIVYSIEPLYTAEIQSAVETFEKHHIRAKKVLFSDATDLRNNVYRQLQGIDVVLLLRDSVIYGNIEYLVRFCKEQNTFLYASDIDSVRKGALLGYADYDYRIGVEMALKGIDVLFKGKCPYQLSSSSIPWKNRLLVNAQTLYQQNIQLDLAKTAAEKIIIY